MMLNCVVLAPAAEDVSVETMLTSWAQSFGLFDEHISVAIEYRSELEVFSSSGKWQKTADNRSGRFVTDGRNFRLESSYSKLDKADGVPETITRKITTRNDQRYQVLNLLDGGLVFRASSSEIYGPQVVTGWCPLLSPFSAWGNASGSYSVNVDGKGSSSPSLSLDIFSNSERWLKRFEMHATDDGYVCAYVNTVGDMVNCPIVVFLNDHKLPQQISFKNPSTFYFSSKDLNIIDAHTNENSDIAWSRSCYKTKQDISYREIPHPVIEGRIMRIPNAVVETMWDVIEEPNDILLALFQKKKTSMGFVKLNENSWARVSTRRTHTATDINILIDADEEYTIDHSAASVIIDRDKH